MYSIFSNLLKSKWETLNFVVHEGQRIRYFSPIQIVEVCYLAATHSKVWRDQLVKYDGYGFRLLLRLRDGKSNSGVIYLRCSAKYHGPVSSLVYEWSSDKASVMKDPSSAEWQAVENFVAKVEKALSWKEFRASLHEYRDAGSRVFQPFDFSKLMAIANAAVAKEQSITFASAQGFKSNKWFDLVEADLMIGGQSRCHVRLYKQDKSLAGVSAWELHCDWNGPGMGMATVTSVEWIAMRALFRSIDDAMVAAGAKPCFPSPLYPELVKVGLFRSLGQDLQELQMTLEDLGEEGNSLVLPPEVFLDWEFWSSKKVPGASEAVLNFRIVSGDHGRINLCLQFVPHPPDSGAFFLGWSGTHEEMTDKQSVAWRVVRALSNKICALISGRNAEEIKSFVTPTPSKPSASAAPKPKTASKTPTAAKTYWPSPQDYNEAIQSPLACFADEQLRNCTVLLNALGLPRATSGAFASVYKLSMENNDWAVRCFSAPVKDQFQRYEKTSRFICSDDLPYTVTCEFLQSGIRVAGNWYPIVKMEWVEGCHLNTFIAENLHDRAALRRLREKFRVMIDDFRLNGIAHGDLQHGNILIRDGEFVVVDYDNMFVPELAGSFSWERGHRNYQHPYRTSKHFGPYLDHFSAWVIDTAILCLEHDPEIWHRFGAGDESILFSARDFLDPAGSPLFEFLSTHPESEISRRASLLEGFISSDLKDVPALG